MSRAADREFADYCCELLAAVGPCTARRMFGGWGIATGGLNLAIIAWDTLYLKANEETRPRFLAAGCRPFAYEARGKTMQLNYYSAPDEAMESAQLMAPWARLALEAALTARAAKAKPLTPAARRSSAAAAPRKARAAPPRARRRSDTG